MVFLTTLARDDSYKTTKTMKATINYDCDAEKIIKLFAPEEKYFSNGRASYSLKKIKSGIKFIIVYKDLAALRAIVNSITNILKVYETIHKTQY